MNQIQTLHQQAMDLAENAFTVKLRGDRTQADQLLRQAFAKEAEAAALVANDLDAEPTRSVLHRSAASLAIECGEFQTAERLIATALAGNPPQEIAEELRNLIFQINSYQYSTQFEGFAVANDEHLSILKQGVETWNDWRRKNPHIIPNLREVDLCDANLSRINFFSAYLYGARLFDANLANANLYHAVLDDANLSGANLSQADLSIANISGAKLFGANLARADLSGANLTRADLSRANLSEAFLCQANLQKAKLYKSDLSFAFLEYADLTNVDLSGTQAIGTNFIRARMTGACLEDWNINSITQLTEVDCQYIFLKFNPATHELEERRPSDPSKNFAPGEFTKLFQEALKAVDLLFSNGIDWKAFFLSFQNLQVEYGDRPISIQAIENKNGGAFVIRLNVPPDLDKGAIERQAMELYKVQLAALEARYRSELHAKDREIEIYREQSTNLWELVRLRANQPVNNYITVEASAVAESKSTSETYNNDQRGAYIANNANKLEGNARQQAKQYNYTTEQKQNLAEAAADIQQLLEQLSQTYPTTTQAEKIAVAAKAAEEIEQNPVLRLRVISALKAGGVEALKELVDHPLMNILLAALEGWQNPE
jgi:uncharacterized protein YjbI with pentapeptide repeats